MNLLLIHFLSGRSCYLYLFNNINSLEGVTNSINCRAGISMNRHFITRQSYIHNIHFHNININKFNRLFTWHTIIKNAPFNMVQISSSYNL